MISRTDSALTPVVATVLFVAITIALTSLVFISVTDILANTPDIGAQLSSQSNSFTGDVTDSGEVTLQLTSGTASTYKIYVNGTHQMTTDSLEPGDTMLVPGTNPDSHVSVISNVDGTEVVVYTYPGGDAKTQSSESSVQSKYDRSWMDSPDYVVSSTRGEDTNPDTPYRTIQAAIDAASTGETILVESGTYREQVRVYKNITVGTREGALVRGWAYSGDCSARYSRSCAFEVSQNAEPIIDGFVVDRFSYGIYAAQSAGEWKAYNVTARSNIWTRAVDVTQSTGDWEIHNSELDETASEGVQASQSSGDWLIAESSVQNNPAGNVDASGATGNWSIVDSNLDDSRSAGVTATRTTGAWSVENTSINNSQSHNVNAEDSNGNWEIVNSHLSGSQSSSVNAVRSTSDWRIENVTLSHNIAGVNAERSRGDWMVTQSDLTQTRVGIRAANSHGAWTVSHSQLSDNTRGAGTAIQAQYTTGAWRVTQSSIVRNKNGIDAQGATVTGNATENYWGGGEPIGPPDRYYPFDYRGNINVSEYLTESP